MNTPTYTVYYNPPREGSATAVTDDPLDFLLARLKLQSPNFTRIFVYQGVDCVAVLEKGRVSFPAPTGPSAFCTMRLENTDTFGGEANYAWVKRETRIVPATITRRAAVRAAKAWAGYTGLRCDVNEVGGFLHIRPRGLCQVLFVDFDYPSRPLSRREATLPGRGWARRWGKGVSCLATAPGAALPPSIPLPQP